MENTNVFDYINVLDKAADASWLRNTAISNNIANASTPNYKRQDVHFEDELMRALGHSAYQTMDSKVYHLNTAELKPEIFTDSESFSYRLDGNNVDIDTENVYLAENQIRYNAILDSVTKEFANLKAVMK